VAYAPGAHFWGEQIFVGAFFLKTDLQRFRQLGESISTKRSINIKL